MADSLARAGNAADQHAATPVLRTEAESEWLAQMERLAEFRSEGLLTDSELVELQAKLRWGAV
jgi:hypothetical protein